MDIGSNATATARKSLGMKKEARKLSARQVSERIFQLIPNNISALSWSAPRRTLMSHIVDAELVFAISFGGIAGL
jgi:hypothetical protein